MAGDFTLSGYKAAATTYLSTELNSLADGGNKLGAAIDNSSNKYLFHDLEISLASAAFAANAYVNVYLLAQVDSEYPDGSDSIDPENSNPVYVAGFRNATAAQVAVILNVPIPNGNFKYLIMQETGVAWASTANTVKYRPHNESFT